MGIGKINKVKADLCSYPPYMFLAPKKFGKTSFWYNLVPYVWGDDTKGLLISFGAEEGYHSLDGIQVEVAKEWSSEYDDETGLRGFVQIVDDIVENNSEYGLKGVCIDTLDTFIDIATKEVLRQHKKEKGTVVKTLNEAFSGYGRGRARLLSICNEQIERLRDAGLAVFMLCHIKNKEKTDLMSGEKYEQITNNLNDDIFTNFADASQIVMTGTYDREIEGGKLLNEKRVIYLRGNSTVDAGGRFTEIPEKINLDVAEFMDAFNYAVKQSIKNSKNDDKTITKMKKEEETERSKKAEIAKKKDKEKKACDPDRNDELVEQIKPLYKAAEQETKDAVKEIMAEYEIESFKDVSETPTVALEKILSTLS